MKKLLKVGGFVLTGLVVALAIVFVFRGFSQYQAGKERAIASGNGIDEAYSLNVRGIEQWIEIRGADRENPVILFVHGGPGAAARPWGYTFQNGWEQDFTIVHWDQRCGGKTYTLNKETGCGNLTVEDLALDGVFVIRHLLERLGKEKLIIVAHSWGTILGLRIAKDHPELLHAYVGSGQIVDSYEAQRTGFQWTLEQARQSNNEKAIAELSALEPFDPEKSWGRHWSWLLHFGGENYTHRNDFYMVWKFFLSPGVSLSEMQDWLDGNAVSNRELRDEERRYRAADVIGYDFDVPVFFFVGRFDYNTPFPLARDYLEKVYAPQKALVVFEESAHSPMWEQPELFVKRLRAYVLPLTQ